jgi:kynurenine formamidase
MPQRRFQKIIELGAKRFTVIDLTEPLREDLQVYPGDPKPKKKLVSSFKSGGCLHYAYTIGDHNFHPHGDAPNHQNPQLKNKGFESWGLDVVFNRACLIDVTGAKNKILKVVTAEHLLPYKDCMKRSAAVVIRTGYDKWLQENRRHVKTDIPYFDRAAIDMIASCAKLKVIATDSLTIDAPGDHYGHRKLKNKLIVECLVNLYRIPKKDRMSFDLQTSPIAIVGASGGPILAYAYVPAT